jgi:hypothetical protein
MLLAICRTPDLNSQGRPLTAHQQCPINRCDAYSLFVRVNELLNFFKAPGRDAVGLVPHKSQDKLAALLGESLI